METRTVQLRAGIMQGQDRHTEAEIREMTVNDVLEAGKPEIVMFANQPVPVPPSENVRTVRMMALRVIRIGTIQQPGEILIKQLSFDDQGRLDRKMEELDRELAAWPEKPAGDKPAGR